MAVSLGSQLPKNLHRYEEGEMGYAILLSRYFQQKIEIASLLFLDRLNVARKNKASNILAKSVFYSHSLFKAAASFMYFSQRHFPFQNGKALHTGREATEK